MVATETDADRKARVRVAVNKRLAELGEPPIGCFLNHLYLCEIEKSEKSYREEIYHDRIYKTDEDETWE